jgi:hypothetical protein
MPWPTFLQKSAEGNTDDFTRGWFEEDSNVNADVFRLVEDIRK